MRIGVTSVADPDVSKKVGDVTVHLEDALNGFFLGKSYGAIDMFVAVVISTDIPQELIDRFIEAHHKVSTMKNPFTSERIKTVSFALPFDHNLIQRATSSKVRQLVCKALIERLDNHGLKIPKTIDFREFADNMKLAVEIYARAQTNM